MKKLCCIKKISILLIMLLTDLLVSCDSMLDFLNNYTAYVTVMDVNLQSEQSRSAGETEPVYPVDKDGYISIPSASDVTFSILLANPNNFEIPDEQIKYTFIDKNAQAIRERLEESGIVPLKIHQLGVEDGSNSRNVIEFTFAEEFLLEMEKGGNISPDIDFLVGDPEREYHKYFPDALNDYADLRDDEKPAAEKFKYRCNSEPLTVDNFTVLQTTPDTPNTNNKSSGTYVLAFNMPDMSGIHGDICRIEIIHESKTISYNLTPSATNETGITFTNGYCDTDSGTKEGFVAGTNDSFVNTLSVSGSGAAFSGKNLKRAVYFRTNVELKVDDYPFTIYLYDKLELKSAEAKVSATSAKLGDIKVSKCDSKGSNAEILESTEENYAEIETDSDSYAYILIESPENSHKVVNGQASDETLSSEKKSSIILNYAVYDKDGKLIKQVAGQKGKSLIAKLTPGKKTFVAWASLPGFVNSDTETNYLNLLGKIYVKQFTEGSADWTEDGGRNSPWKTIDAAITSAVSQNFEKLQLQLLSDITVENTLKINSTEKMPLEISGEKSVGNGYYSINAENEETTAIYIPAKENVTFRNIKLQSLEIENDAVVNLMENTVADYISLKENAVINAIWTENSEFEYLARIKVEKPVVNLPVINIVELNEENEIVLVKTEDIDAKKLVNYIDKFQLQNPGYYITVDDDKSSENYGKGIVSTSGLELKLPKNTDGYEISLKGINSDKKIEKGSECYVSGIKNSNGISLKSEEDYKDLKLVLYDEAYIEIASSANGTDAGKLTIPQNIPEGKYRLEISFDTIDGLSQNAWVLIEIVNREAD